MSSAGAFNITASHNVPTTDNMDIDDIAPSIRAFRNENHEEANNTTTFLGNDVNSGNGDLANKVVLVLDTNIVVSKLTFLSQIVSIIMPQITEQQVPPVFVFMVPMIVIRELDGLKKSTKLVTVKDSNVVVTLGELARSAITWLESVMNKNGIVIGQRKHQVLSSQSVSHQKYDGEFDDMILECCFYFQQGAKGVALLTDDKNLVLKSKVEGIQHIGLLNDNDPAFIPSFFKDISALLIRQTTSSTPQQPFSHDVPEFNNQKDVHKITPALNVESFIEYVRVHMSRILSPIVYSHLFHRYASNDFNVLKNVLTNPPERSKAYEGIPDVRSAHWPSWTASRSLELMERFWHSTFEDLFLSNSASNQAGVSASNLDKSRGLQSSRWSSAPEDYSHRDVERIRKAVTRLKNALKVHQTLNRFTTREIVADARCLLTTSTQFLSITDTESTKTEREDDDSFEDEEDTSMDNSEKELPEPESLTISPHDISSFLEEAATYSSRLA